MSPETAVTPDLLRRRPLPDPREGGSKEARGRALVVAGSLEVPGAALLAGVAALRAGAGKLQMGVCQSLAIPLGLAVPEARVVALPETRTGGIRPEAAGLLLWRARQCGAVLVGPGMMDEDAVAELTSDFLAGVKGPALVIDAAAMMGLRNQLASLRRQRGRAVITPHAGEMAGLLGIELSDVEADPLGTARHAAALLQTVVVLKGACTRIVTPEGEAWCSGHGNVGLATSGSGDTLAGIIAGLLARGADPVQASLWGVHMHAEAGNRMARARGPLGYLARELLGEIPAILADLAGAGPPTPSDETGPS